MNIPLPIFDKRDFLVFRGELLRLENEWEDGSLSLTRVERDRPFFQEDGSIPTRAWFHQQWACGNLHLRSSRAIRGRPLSKEPEPGSEKERKAALVRFTCISLDHSGCKRSNPAIAKALSTIWSPEIEAQYGKVPPASTVRKWLGRSIVDNRTRDGCAPRSGEGPRTPRLDSEVLKLRDRAALLYWTEFGLTIEDVHADHVRWVAELNTDRAAVGLDAVRACSLEWMRQRVRKLENRRTYACKFGERAAQRRFDTNGFSPVTSQVLELCSIDHHTWDNLCCFDEIGDELLLVGRPTTTGMFDHHTGCILSAVTHATDPSLHNMLDALKVANRPKLNPTRIGERFGKTELLASIYGKGDTILPDNAYEFTGKSAQDSFLDVGLSVDWSRAGEAQDKQLLERFWRFLSVVVARKLPAAVFDVKLMRELGYDPTKARPVLLSDLRMLIAEAVAFWHLKHYKRVGGAPALLWQKAVRQRGGIPVIRDDSKLDQLMGEVAQTTLTTSGVILFAREYSDLTAVTRLLENLVPLSPAGRHKQICQTARVPVKVKYNPTDLTYVHVYDRSRAEYVTLKCKDPYFHGLSKKHVEALSAYAKHTNNAFMTPEDTKVARSMLNEFIRKVSPGSTIRQQKRLAKLSGGTFAEEPRSSAHRVQHVIGPSSYDAKALPLIEHEPAVLTRSDGGQPPSGPPARGQAAKAKRAKVAEVASRSSQTKAIELARLPAPSKTNSSWGGLK